MSIINFMYKSFHHVVGKIVAQKDRFITAYHFCGNGVQYKNYHTGGIPYVMVARKAKGFTIGNNFYMNNNNACNPIGVNSPCTFFVDNGCSLTIGDNVGISQTALIAHADITIGDDVKIGGGTCIYTTDFHSLDASIRSSEEDTKHKKTAPVVVGNNVFIGAHCIILKGVTIGENSVVGAGSVVTKSIPSNEIWGGNPAKLIRRL